MDYSEYQHLLFERFDPGILLITINRPEVLNATNRRLHWELSRVWLDVADDDVHPFGAPAQRERLAHAAARPGDNGGLTRELFHEEAPLAQMRMTEIRPRDAR